MITHIKYNMFYIVFLLVSIIFALATLTITVLAQNDLSQLISFENDSDIDYYFDGNNDGIDNNNGYGSSKRSLKLAEANCLNSSWTRAYVQGSGNINFMRINELDFASFFELVVSLDGNVIKSINCNPLNDWLSLDSPLRIHNLDNDFHELTLEYKYKDRLHNNGNPFYPKSTLWIDDIKTTGSLVFAKNICSPCIIKKSGLNATITEALMRCNEIKIEKGTNLQYVLDVIESMQNQEDVSQKTLILQGGEYPGPIMIKNLKKITLKNEDDEDVVFSGHNTSLELINSFGIVISGLNFGKSNDKAMLILDCHNCIIENNKISGFNSSGIKMVNCTSNKIRFNRLQSNQKMVDGISLSNSSSNEINSNFIYIDNYCYVFKNESFYNTIVHIDNGDKYIFKDHELIFGVNGSIFSKDGNKTFDPNQESLNKWGVA